MGLTVSSFPLRVRVAIIASQEPKFPIGLSFWTVASRLVSDAAMPLLLLFVPVALFSPFSLLMPFPSPLLLLVPLLFPVWFPLVGSSGFCPIGMKLPGLNFPLALVSRSRCRMVRWGLLQRSHLALGCGQSRVVCSVDVQL